MARNNSIYFDMSKINANSLFDSSEEPARFVEMPISELCTFKNYPFKVIDDERMEDLIESIKEYDVLTPIVVRKCDTGYEIISGHRRTYASKKIGLKHIPAIIINGLSDDEATIMMVDSNIHCEEILPSEKAFSYKMKLEAMSHQGKRNSSEIKSRADEQLAEQVGESRSQTQFDIIMTEDNSLPKNVSLNIKKFSKYFPDSYSDDEIETIIFSLLDKWSKKEIDV
jgi:ParB family chromosome partitioning protein